MTAQYFRWESVASAEPLEEAPLPPFATLRRPRRKVALYARRGSAPGAGRNRSEADKGLAKENPQFLLPDVGVSSILVICDV